MSLDLTCKDFEEIYAEAERHGSPARSIDAVETVHSLPASLGSGYERMLELCSGLHLGIFNSVYRDMTVRFPENSHPVQFAAYLSGALDSGEHLQVNPQQGYVGGSGMQPHHFMRISKSCRLVGVEIHMTPVLFEQFLADAHGELPAALQPLIQENDWQRRFSPRMTRAMQTVVRQMMDCPFSGVIKQTYLQAKVFELIAFQLGSITEKHTQAAIKADTLARIHHAAEILRSRLENPPSHIELAQQVGVGQTTLNKGFRAVFGMTPLAYLTRHRMEQAQLLLRQPDCTVVDVANRMGYKNPSKFAFAFKRQFGMTPRDCMRGAMGR